MLARIRIRGGIILRLAFILCIILSSCSLGNKYYLSLDKAWIMTSQHEYMIETNDTWKSPEVFSTDGGGDCEDFAIYMVSLLGPGSYLAATVNHAVVYYDGQFIEPQTYGKYYAPGELSILYMLNYTQIMLLTSWAARGSTWK